MYCIRVVIILLRTGLYKSAFPTYYFGKTSFSSIFVLVFRVYISSQPAITRSELTIETLEQCVKYVQS